MGYLIREISSDDKVNSFSMGDAAHVQLKTFLKKNAKSLHNFNITKTYVMVQKEKQSQIIGYMSLVCSEISFNLEQRPKETKYGKEHKTFPAIKLARLAISKEHQGKQLGKNLTLTAIGIVKDYIMPRVGCRYFIVDSKIGALDFYKKLGFVLLDHPENLLEKHPLLFFDMHPIK